ncbi:MAG: c-type cytochrome [Pseudomonadota bacterium]
MSCLRRVLAVCACLLALPAFAGEAGFLRLEGHGGPVKGIAVSPQADRALTASFDNALGLWSMPEGHHLGWLEGHEAAANAVVFLPGNRALSAGDDFRLILWDLATRQEIRRYEGHRGKIIALAVSPDGSMAASAGWDGVIGLWQLETGEVRWLEGHTANVNDVAFGPGGAVLYSAGYDGTLRRWDLNDTSHTPYSVVVSHGFGLNHLELSAEAGWVAYGAVDGTVRVRDLATGETLADMTAERKPILALDLSADGQLAVGDGEGYIMVIDTADWSVERDFRAALRGPIWALAWEGAGRLLAGGIADEAAAWPVSERVDSALFADGPRSFHADPGEMSNGERQFMRKCSICHSLEPEGGRKAGPTLWGVFGRKAGTLAGYRYSDALIGSPIIWSDATIAQLFRDGPDVVTPGSKMPVQRIAEEADRRDLVAFLRARTIPENGIDAAEKSD